MGPGVVGGGGGGGVISPLFLSFKISLLTFFLSKIKKKGINTIKPTKNLTPLNTYGPISSMPVSCAINVVPQINVHNKALPNESDLDIFKELTYKQNLLRDFLLTHCKTSLLLLHL